MRKPRKVLIAVLLVIVAMAATWLLVQAHREVGYRAVLARYQHDLHPGMTRTAVDNYLKPHQIHYGVAHLGGSGNAWSYLIRIGTEQSLVIFVCGQIKIDVVLDFDPPGRKDNTPAYGGFGDPSDVLKDVRIVKMAECL